jgi:hypothetical protein
VVVHELTHYLQGHYDEPQPFPTTDAQYTQYLKLPSEQEAFAAAAYYYTRKYALIMFTEIMSSNKSIKSNMDDLLNYHFRTSGYNVVWKNRME